MLNLDKTKKYLLACSYGPDSMYLFSLLEKEGYKFSVAHVNYHFRDESDEEEKLLREYCAAHKVELFVYDNKEKVTSNVEEKARVIRYWFFKNEYMFHGFDALLVAHNKDDHLETYLLQKHRKNLPIFYGINSETTINRMKVIRPMLDVYKDDVLAYNKEHNIPYAIDKTNLENKYQRNKIRNEYLSKLTREEKDSIILDIDKENKRLKNIYCKLNSVYIHSVQTLLNFNDEELAYAINFMVKEVLPEHECSMRFIREMRKVLLSDKPNVIIPLDGSYSLSKEYERLEVRELRQSFVPIFVSKPEVIDTDMFYFDLVRCGEAKGITSDCYPLSIRPARKEDKYHIKDYDVSVRRLFIDWKMPIYLRNIWPVFEHEGRIIYIPRYRSDFTLEKDQYFYVKYGFALKK